MAWLQLHMRLSSNDYSAVESSLEEMGALSLTLMDAQDQPIFEPTPGEAPIWDELKVTSLYQEDVDAQKVRAVIDGMEQVTLHEWSQEILEDDDWERKWMTRFEPMQFGNGLWIIPSWHKAPEPDAVNISLDPGLAFGSGTHETTSLCLEWLSKNRPHNLHVLDFGCGSGILAVAALKLGAESAVGTDIDPQALITSRDNADKNGVPKNSFALYLPKDMPEAPYDLVLANILSGPLIELSSLLATYTNHNGRIILSGILREQAEQVAKAYEPWFEMSAPEFKGDWTKLTGVRNSSPASLNS